LCGIGIHAASTSALRQAPRLRVPHAFSVDVSLQHAPSRPPPDADRFQRLMEASGVGMAIVGLDGRIERANPALAAMLGATPAGLAGRNVREFSHPDDLGLTDRLFADLIEGRCEHAQADKRYRAADGRCVDARLDTILVHDADGKPAHFLSQVTDLGAQREAERELQLANANLEQRVSARTRELETACEDLQRFAYGVSHDLRAPLRSIASFGKLLDDHAGAGLDEQGRDYLRRIREASAQMQDLIGSLQELSRVMYGEFRSEPVDASLLADWAGAELQDAEQQRAASIVVQPGLVVRGDERALKQLFGVLLHNAWKFSRDRERVEVEVAGARAGEMLRIEVRDRGIGYDPRYAGKLFQPFQRLHTAAEGAGNGLGLAIARRIVERHGGRIHARSEPGAGATFIIELPAGDAG
jgi:PAS domain S-box-containing protein